MRQNEVILSAIAFRVPASALAVLLLMIGHSSEAQPVHATLMTSVSPAHCVQALAAGTGVDLIRCPAPLRMAVTEAITACRNVDGTLSGEQEGIVWALDVNGDGRQEVAFELDGNVACEGAYSLFSCGSLGCPKSLFELRAGQWTLIGSLSASAPDDITVATAAASDGHRALEVCTRERCAERWTYEWSGTVYDTTRLEAGGAAVDVASSIRGLYSLAAATTVRAAPRANATDVGRYDAGTEVAIVGTAEGADYYYVSPCNACDSGFVPRSAVAVP